MPIPNAPLRMLLLPIPDSPADRLPTAGALVTGGAGHILVVDDIEPNRILLQDVLEPRGYDVQLCASGIEALEVIRRGQPDLVLLDVNMPGTDGLEVCRRLRANPETASLPIILVTAMTRREERLEGIAAGANDYLTKPIDRPELLLRVRNALQLRALHRQVANQYAQLQRAETLRDSLVHMLVHDLRSPLTGMTLYLHMIRETLANFPDDQLISDLDELQGNVGLLTDMVANVLDVSRAEGSAMPLEADWVDLRETAEQALGTVGPTERQRVELVLPREPVRVRADAEIIRRVIANLVGNALKFSPAERRVRLLLDERPNGPEVRVLDSGPGIPDDARARIFEKFHRIGGDTQTAGRSTGLGLTFCKMAIEAHGGRIGVESQVCEGSAFWFTLPRSTEGASDLVF